MGKLMFGIIAIISSIAGIELGHGWVFWTGVGILSFIGLIVFSLITWGLLKLIKGTLTLALYDILACVTLCTLMFKGVIGVNVALTTCIPLTAIFSFIVVRLIGTHAQTSVIWSEIFSWVTGYKIKYYIKEKAITTRQAVVEDKEERDNLIAILKELEYPVKFAKEAADYAINENPDASMENKTKCALNYINSEKISRS